jgi:hypothetical protein
MYYWAADKNGGTIQHAWAGGVNQSCVVVFSETSRGLCLHRLTDITGVRTIRQTVARRCCAPRQLGARGQAAGEVVFGPDTQHDLRSVTKSLVSLLYGIALADKRVPPVDAPLLNGGQLLVIIPARELVVVVTAGNYNDPRDWQVPDEVLPHFVLPCLKA